ncbi:hypothetical protein GOP47_0002931 [Adiantum capillus-veneris]|uniref:DUF7812 domain-containing protein n=1 Tax=Adiantum capillus-veneris TaxID=13818 RepID=A0A9D4VBG8_ADICA|nr:hypothetical protein GOP47_0002931 [Adiantum capillus-veneris]
MAVLKTESLHHLALFLLYVAPTSESTFTCADANTISLHFRDKSIFLALKDIQTLYRLIFVELANCINWLFKWECAGKVSGHTFADHTCGSHCDHTNIEFTVKLLQCCIYILPLLEFNTGLSLVAADTINSLFEQLVCPASHFRLHLKELDEVADTFRTLILNRGRLQAFCCVQCACVHSYTPRITSVEASINNIIKDRPSHENTDLFCSLTSVKKDTSCALHEKTARTDRNGIALVLLEVFLEELLLQPRLANILKAGDVLQSQFSPENYVILVMEAAAMHFTFSVLGGAHTKVLQQNVEQGSFTHHVFSLSLPAAVRLLDLSIVDDICAPDTFLIHIINVLRCSLNRSSCLREELSEEVVLGFVASALESATSLYFKCWKAKAVPPHQNLLQCGQLLKCLSNKFSVMCDGDSEKVALLLDLLLDQENNLKALQQEKESTHSGLFCTYHKSFYNVQQRQEQLLPMNHTCLSSPIPSFLETKATLLVSILHLISTALFSLIAEAAKTLQTSRTPNSEDQSCSNAEVYIRDVRQLFKFCASVERITVLSNLTLDKELQNEILEVDQLTGNAFTFFAEWLLLCIKHDAPNALQQAYLEVLKSLLTLNWILQRISNSASAFELLCKAQLRPSCDAIVANVEEDQHGDQQPCTNVCKQYSDSEPCSSGYGQQTADFASSTLLMTKIYQRKHKRLVRTHRKSETRVAASQSEQLDSDQHRQEEGNLRKNEMITGKYRSSGNGDAFIKDMLAFDGDVNGECFSDLNDFIVCKEGRDYSKWLKLHYKKRKKKLRKTVLQRMKAKRAFVSLLTRQDNDHL